MISSCIFAALFFPSVSLQFFLFMLHTSKPGYNVKGESARSRYDDDHMVVVESFDPPACDGYLHPGNCRICYDTLAAFNDEDSSFSAFTFFSDSNKEDL